MSICSVSMSPAMAVPPNVLKKVIALVMNASMRAFPQSNFCSTAAVVSFVQQIMNPLTVKVRFLGFILPRQFSTRPLRVNDGFVRG